MKTINIQSLKYEIIENFIDYFSKLIVRYEEGNKTLQGLINTGYKKSKQKDQIKYNNSIIDRVKQIVANEKNIFS